MNNLKTEIDQIIKDIETQIEEDVKWECLAKNSKEYTIMHRHEGRKEGLRFALKKLKDFREKINNIEGDNIKV